MVVNVGVSQYLSSGSLGGANGCAKITFSFFFFFFPLSNNTTMLYVHVCVMLSGVLFGVPDVVGAWRVIDEHAESPLVCTSVVCDFVFCVYVNVCLYV